MKPLLVAAGILVAVLAGTGIEWAKENFYGQPHPQRLPDDPRLKFRSSAFIAREAVRRYRALPPEARDSLRRDLLASLSDLESWSTETTARARLVCLGERHDDAVRRFLAFHVLPRLDYRVLMLETGEDGLATMRAELALDGKALLLGARIDPIMRAVGRSGIPPRLVAIDESREELEHRVRRSTGDRRFPTREETLTRKVLSHWQGEARALVIMGALHCRDTPGWLFHRLASARPAPHANAMLAVTTLARSQETGARMLFYFLEEMDIRRPVVVVPDVARFPRQIQSWLPQVADAFAGYDSVLAFDDGAT